MFTPTVLRDFFYSTLTERVRICSEHEWNLLPNGKDKLLAYLFILGGFWRRTTRSWRKVQNLPFPVSSTLWWNWRNAVIMLSLFDLRKTVRRWTKASLRYQLFTESIKLSKKWVTTDYLNVWCSFSILTEYTVFNKKQYVSFKNILLGNYWLNFFDAHYKIIRVQIDHNVS